MRMNDANNTSRSFSDKWVQNPDLGYEETLNEASDTFQWIVTRNGFDDGDRLRQYLKGKRRILDAGCGNGRVTLLLRRYAPDSAEVIGIDLVAAEVARQNLAQENIQIHDGNLLEDLSFLGSFDFIYCQEVLHHTGDATAAFANVCSLLEPGGEIAIYVYRQKAPVREFVDDFIRQNIAELDYAESMKACEQVTALGKALADLDIQVDLPAVNLLDIPEGRYDIQRFFYHFFMKCYWNPGYSFHDNVVVNYDWYHPQNCSRHTLDEVRGWFRNNGLDIVHEHEDFYGITMRGEKAEV